MGFPSQTEQDAGSRVPANLLQMIGDSNVERAALRAMIDVVPDYIFVKDQQSRFVLANRAVAKDIGLSVEDLLGKTDFDLHPSELARRFFEDEQSVIRTGEPLLDIEEFVVHPSGRKIHLLTSKVPFRGVHGEVIGIVGVSRDVSARHLAEEALAESESRWKFALEGAGHGVWDLNLRNGTAFYSGTWRQMRGIGADEEVDPSREAWLARVHPEDRARLIEVTDQQDDGTLQQNAFEYRERHRDGRWMWILSRGKPVEWNWDGSIARIIGTDMDITSLREAEARHAAEIAETYRRHLAALEKAHEATETARQIAQSMSRQDALTGLPNRRVFAEEIENAIVRSAEGGTSAVLIIDLDHFKPVNDVYGHAAGDEVLTEVARRLVAVTRKEDLVARLGGDEFGAILQCSANDDPREVAASFAERVAKSVSRPIALGEHAVNVGASIGIALCPANGRDPDTLLRAADMAMYRAKDVGRGTFQRFEPAMESALQERRALEEDVRKAVANEDIQPHYQPLVRLTKDELVGFEILARWDHPGRGPIEPDTFIPIVEKVGLIGELTYSLLRRACRDAEAWPETITLALNISPAHLSDPLLPVRLLGILSEANFPPRRLEIEVTETALVADLETARSALTTLQSLGIKISLDDFGVGYSSLYNLRELHFDKIKIDRSFVQSMHSNIGSAKIVQSVIELAKSLGLPTIAEGIEHQEALHQIMHNGGEFGQGFYFGKAMPAAAATALVEQHARDEFASKSA